MKNLWILMVGLLVVGCGVKPVVYELPAAPEFRMTDKSQITSLEAADKFLIEDDSDADSTQYTTLDDINTYLGSIYQPLTAHLTDLADGNITSNFVNETYPWADNEVADDLTIAKLQLDHNVETLAANKTLVITDKVIQKLDANGTDRDVLLPPEASNSTNLVFMIYNMSGEVGEDLNIQDDAAVDILSVGYLQLALCTCDGTTWVVRCLACAGAGDVIDLRAKEENTSAIVTGQPVYISGATGAAYPNVGLADCDDSSKVRARGLASEDISQNSTGYIRAKGLLEDVNSTKGSAVNPLSQDWIASDQLWVSATAGGLTNVRPIGRNIKAGTALTVEGSSSKILVYPRESPIYTGAASGEDIICQMGDSAGANKISYTDFAGNEVASLDSDGNATYNKVTSASKFDTNGTYEINGTQITSGALSDETSIAMLDEAETIAENWVNEAYPWVDNEMADNHTMGSGGTIHLTPIQAACSSDVSDMLGSANDAAILNNIGDGIVILADTTLADEDYLWFWDYSDNGTTKRVDADEIRNVAASTTLAGEIAIATTAEVNTGTNATIAVVPDALAGSVFGQKDIGWTIYDSDDNTTVADGKKGYAYPYATDMEIYEVVCAVDDLNSAASGTTTVMLRRVHNGSDNDTLSVGVTIDYDEYSAHDATIDTNKHNLTKGDLLYFDVDAITSPPHKGLSCTVIVHRP